jgi:hypothetical protein
MVKMNDIYKINNSNHESGIYCVVGLSNGIVLLKIGDLNNNRVNTGHIIKITERKLQRFDNTSIPDKNIRQKILSEIDMLPYILSANYHRMKSNKVLNIVSLILLTSGILFDVLGLGHSLISSIMILLGSLGFALSMSVLYNS